MISNGVLIFINLLSGALLIMGAVKRDSWYVHHHTIFNRVNRTWRYAIRFAIGGLVLITVLDAVRELLSWQYEALLPWYVTGLGVWYSSHLYFMWDIKLK